MLSLEIRKAESELSKLNENLLKERLEPKQSSSEGTKCYQVKLNNYSWDQSDKFVKIYVTLQNAHTCPEENVLCTFTDRSMTLSVRNLGNRDYTLVIKNLLEPIDVAKSTWKVKTDMVIVNLAKTTTNNWSHMTELEKRASESKKMDTTDTDDLSKDSDPSAGLMNIMKKMYQSGDDDMKRMIAKAWVEGQEKKGAEGLY